MTDKAMPLDEVVFADTGSEKPETYQYLDETIYPFLIEKGIPFTRVQAKRKDGSLDTLEARCWRARAIPDRVFRWSTRDYKIRPIYKHLRPHIKDEGVTIYLGIAFDEIERMKQEHRQRGIVRDWPLIDAKMTREDCVKLISAHGWKVPVKSGCWFCPFSSLADWKWLLDNHPTLYEQAIAIEKNGSRYPNFSLKDGTTLTNLRKRFQNEDKAAREQLNLDMYNEECEGFCMT